MPPPTPRRQPARNARTVRWIDSAIAPNWQDRDLEDYKPIKVKTVGYVVREDEEVIVLAQGIADNGDFLNVVIIPKVSILK